MIKAVIFDLGFTLVGNENFTIERYLGLIHKGINNVAKYLIEIKKIDEGLKKKLIRQFKKIRYKTYDEVFSKYVEYSTEYCLKKTFDVLNIEYDDELIHKCAGVLHVIEGDFWKPFPSTEKTLKELKKNGIKIALLSNAPYDKGIKTLLKAHNLIQYFDLIETSANIGYAKPNPITFQTVLKQLNVKPEEAVMVGDDLLNDCKGASDVGMICIRVKKHFAFPYEIELDFEPDFTVENIGEIPEIIKKLNKIS